MAGALDVALGKMWLREWKACSLSGFIIFFKKTHCLALSSLLTQGNSVLTIDNAVDLVVLGIGLWASVLVVKHLSSWTVVSKSMQALKYMKEISPPSL